MTEPRILVTGGSGFIGRHVVASALASGHAVLNLDFRPPRSEQELPYWRRVDIRDRDALEREVLAFAPTHIAHLASDIGISQSDIAAFGTILEGSRNLRSAAAKLPSLQRLVHVSTQYVVTPGRQPASETDLHPYTTYGEAKALVERSLWESPPEFDWRIVRPAIIWGPEHPDFPDQIWRFIGNRKYLHPRTRSPILRCYGYVENTAEQIFAVLTAGQLGTKRVYYLGDENMSYDRWVDGFALALTGKPARRIGKGLLFCLGCCGEILKALRLKPPFDLGRYFRMTTSSAQDLSPIREIAGPPKIAFEEALQRTLAWLETRPSR